MPIQTWLDFFSANYYENTYLPPVDLSEEALAPDLLEATEPEAAAIAQQLLSQEEVRQVLTEPLSFDRNDLLLKNQVLTNHGFKLEGTARITADETIPCYYRISHSQLPNKSILTTAARTTRECFSALPPAKTCEIIYLTKKQGILALAQSQRIAKIAQKSHIPIFTLASKLVPYAPPDPQSDITKKYCIISNDADVLTAEETIERIATFDADTQQELATNIATLIKKTGFVSYGFNSVRLTRTNELYIETEPASRLMVARKPSFWTSLFQKKGSSVEACARIALSTLLEETKIKVSTPYGITGQNIQIIPNPKLQAFHDVIAREYSQTLHPKLSSAKIFFSILSIGLLPFIYACKAAFESFKLNQLQNELIECNRRYLPLFSHYDPIHLPPSAQQKRDMEKNYFRERSPILKQRASLLQGVPHIMHP